MALGLPLTPTRSVLSDTTVTLAAATATQISGSVGGAAAVLAALGFQPSRARQGIELSNPGTTVYLGSTNAVSPTNYEYQLAPGETLPLSGNGSRQLWAYNVAGTTFKLVELD